MKQNYKASDKSSQPTQDELSENIEFSDEALEAAKETFKKFQHQNEIIETAVKAANEAAEAMVQSLLKQLITDTIRQYNRVVKEEQFFNIFKDLELKEIPEKDLENKTTEELSATLREIMPEQINALRQLINISAKEPDFDTELHQKQLAFQTNFMSEFVETIERQQHEQEDTIQQQATEITELQLENQLLKQQLEKQVQMQSYKEDLSTLKETDQKPNPNNSKKFE